MIANVRNPASAPLARTMPDMLREQAALRPNSLAVITPKMQSTFCQLLQRAHLIAGALARAGIQRTDRVGLLHPNSLEWLEIMFGAHIAGATLVPFSTWSTKAELDFLTEDSKVALVFSGRAFNGRDFATDLREVLAARSDDSRPLLVIIDDLAPAGMETLDSFLNGAQPLSLPPGQGPSAIDDAVILYTSGSTSRPKGVRLKHYAAVENGFNIGERQGLRSDDRVFLPAPLFWSFGGVNALPAAFTHGASLVLPEKFEAGGALDMIEEHRCTAIYTLPAMTNAMLRHAGFDAGRTRSLRTGLTIGGPSDVKAAVESLGVDELCNIYGATETYGNCAVTWHHWPLERRMACQGPPLPGVEMRFRDPDSGQLLPTGSTGFLEVKGYVTPGYSGHSSQLNAETFTKDGFYRTGDIGRLDADGSFVFVGRNSEMIKRAGINVSPAEIEDVLQRCDGVGLAAVVGVPDAERGEVIVAYVTPKDGEALQHDALADHCRTYLSKYKIPDRIEIASELPLTPTGKLQRNEVKKNASRLLADAGRVDLS